MSKTFKERAMEIDFFYPDQIQDLVIALCEAVDDMAAPKLDPAPTDGPATATHRHVRCDQENCRCRKSGEDWHRVIRSGELVPVE